MVVANEDSWAEHDRSSTGRHAVAGRAERRSAGVLREAGFSHVRRATKTPFNIIPEAGP